MKTLKVIIIASLIQINAEQIDDVRSDNYSRLRNSIEKIFENMDEQKFLFWKFVELYSPLFQSVENRFVENLNSGKFTSVVDARKYAAVTVIGQENYNRLVYLMSDEFNKTSEMPNKKLSIAYLSKILAADSIGGEFSDMVNNANGASVKEYAFYIEEALAYLGKNEMKNRLRSRLDDPAEKEKIKINAIHAIAILEWPNISEYVKSLMKNDEILIAQQGFALYEKWKLEFDASDAIIHKLKRYSDKNEQLDDNQKLFLSTLVNEAMVANRNNALPDKSIGELKDLAIVSLRGQNETVRREAVKVLWEFAESSDEPFLVELLDDENPDVQAFAAFAFFRLPKRYVIKNSDKLLELLEHKHFNVRKWALFSLAYGVGKPISSMISQEEFNRVKSSIMKEYK